MDHYRDVCAEMIKPFHKRLSNSDSVAHEADYRSIFKDNFRSAKGRSGKMEDFAEIKIGNGQTVGKGSRYNPGWLQNLNGMTRQDPQGSYRFISSGRQRTLRRTKSENCTVEIRRKTYWKLYVAWFFYKKIFWNLKFWMINESRMEKKFVERQTFTRCRNQCFFFTCNK